jgi:glycine/D-amino acid oxidase-like deaminating enzyme
VRPGSQRDLQFRLAAEELRAHFAKLFPALDGVEIERAWEGLFAMTPDTLPYIGAHRRYPGHLFALGYGGNGMTFAALAARLLLDEWRGHRSRDHDLFSFGRLRR